MKVAAFNVENLFSRARAFNQPGENSAKPILKATADLNALFERAVYCAAVERRMIELMKELGLEKSDRGRFVILRRIRGKIVRRPRDGAQ